MKGGISEMMERTERCVVAAHNIIIDVGNIHAMRYFMRLEWKQQRRFWGN